MIDLHTHSIFSDGVLIPSEVARRYEFAGYSAVAITDHVDRSNFDFVIPRVLAACNALNSHLKLQVIPGVEITHVPPEGIEPLVTDCRKAGAMLVGVHGETITEPVAPGTNKASILARVDFLAHPGLLSLDEATLAREKGVYLEISGRKGHSFGNGHVVSLARKVGAKLVLNSDFHQPGDMLSSSQAENILLGAGLTRDEVQETLKNSEKIVRSLKNEHLRKES
ncbi:MAG: histidinol phosphate phosphatase domain-containing protein [Nitrospinota bacterium]